MSENVMDFIICKICEAPFKDQKEYDEHSKSHVKVESKDYINILKCEKCEIKFENQKELNIHLWQHLGVFSCRDCEERFFSLADLEVHTQKGHHIDDDGEDEYVEEEVLAESDRTVDLDEDDIRHDEKFTCKTCLKTFNDEDSFRAHSKTHIDSDLAQCDECSSTFSTAGSLTKHKLKFHNERIHQCRICSKQFNCEISLNDHEKCHENADLYECAECNETFEAKHSLANHLKLHLTIKSQDSDKFRYACSICDAKFNRQSVMNDHLVLHENPNAFKCSDCPKKYSTAASLKHHRILHKEPDKYRCKICQKNFTRYYYLKLHENTHSDDGHFCKYCNQKFALNTRKIKLHEEKCSMKIYKSPESLNKEKDVNGSQLVASKRNYKCRICNAEYHSRYNFINHIKLHENPNIFRCNECLRNFASMRQLRMHRELHINPDTHKCSICQKNFTRFHDLERHLLTHSKTQNRCKYCSKIFSPDQNKLEMHEEKCWKNKTRQVGLVNKSKHDDTPKFDKEQNKDLQDQPKHDDTQKVEQNTDSQDQLILQQNINERVKIENEVSFELILPSNDEEMDEPQDENKDIDETLKNSKVDPKKYICGLCTASFSLLISFQTHLRLHQNPDLFKCSICFKRFSCRRSLKRHQNLHKNSNKLQCTYCKTCFSNTRHLESHLQNCYKTASKLAEANEKLEKNIPMEYNLSRNFITHMELKQNPDLFKCNECSKIYSSKRTLQLHQNVHSNKLRCEICLSNHRSVYDLKRHMKIHSKSDIHCKYCNKQFSANTRYLESHEQNCSKNSASSATDNPTTSENNEMNVKEEASEEQSLDHLSHFDQNESNTGTENSIEGSILQENEFLLSSAGGDNDTNNIITVSHNETIQISDVEEEVLAESDRRTFDLEEDDIRYLMSIKFKRYICNICEVTTSTKYRMVVHLKLHINPNLYKCNDCPKKFGTASSLKRHSFKHTDFYKNQVEENQLLKCNKCFEGFTDEISLKLHYKNAHNTTEKYNCPICDKSFWSFYQKNQHISTHQKLECKYCYKKCWINAENLKIHEEKCMSTIKYICDLCNTRYTDKNDLIIHMELHKNYDLFKCDKCLKCFTEEHFLKLHQKMHELTDKYNCPICHKSFANSYNRNKHILKHNGLECKYCFKKFKKSAENLRIHEEKCMDNLNMSTPNKETPEMYFCNICDASYVRRSDLKVHQELHKNPDILKCNLCLQRFAFPRSLRVHIKQKHNNVDTIKCKTCEKGFKITYDLQQHLNVSATCDQNMLTAFSGHDESSHCYLSDKNKIDENNCDELENFDQKSLSKYGDNINEEIHAINVLEPHKFDSNKTKMMDNKNIPTQAYLSNIGSDYSNINLNKEKGVGNPINEETTKNCEETNSDRLPMSTGDNEEMYFCNSCNAGYVRKYDLTVHMELHQNPDLLKCNLCPYRFYFPKSLRVHVRQKHKNVDTVKCKTCKKGFKISYDLQQHMKANTECNQYQNLSTAVSGGGTLNQCYLLDTNKMDDHKCDKLEISNQNCLPEESVGDNMIEEILNKNATVEECDVNDVFEAHEFVDCNETKMADKSSILDKNELSNVENEYSNFDLNEINSLTNAINEDKTKNRRKKSRDISCTNKKKNMAKTKYCNICNAAFTRDNSLRIHLELHHNPDLFKCEVCSKHFTFPSNLRSHLKSHGQPKRKKCPSCRQTFIIAYDLQRHLQSSPNCNRSLSVSGSNAANSFLKKTNVAKTISSTRNELEFIGIFEDCTIKTESQDYNEDKVDTNNGLKPHEFVDCNETKTADRNILLDQDELSNFENEFSNFNSNDTRNCEEKRSDISCTNKKKINAKKFYCDICDAAFAHEYHLKVHLELHENPDLFKCEVCWKKFTFPGNLRAHLKNHKRRAKKRCPSCPRSFLISYDLQRHLQSSLKCKKNASNMTSSNDTSKQNCLSVKNNQMYELEIAEEFICEVPSTSICNKIEKNEPEIIKTEAHDSRDSKEEIGDNDIFELIKTEPQEFVECNETVVTEVKCIEVNTFTNEEHGFIEDKIKTISEQKNNRTKKKFNCKKCPLRFQSIVRFRRHMKVHEKPAIFKCKKCSICFTRKNNLKAHFLFHTNPDLLTCKTCKKVFATLGHLKRHLPVHSETGLHCKYCNVKFMSNTYILKKHERRCLGNKVKTQLSTKVHISDTVRNEEQKLNDKSSTSFDCDNPTTSDQISDEKNEDRNAIFECKKCPFEFENLRNLKTHMMLHKSPKRYKCNVCSVSFTRRNNLKTHLVCHTNPELVTCKICRKEFSSLHHLKRHMPVHSETGLHCRYCNIKFMSTIYIFKKHEKRCLRNNTRLQLSTEVRDCNELENANDHSNNFEFNKTEPQEFIECNEIMLTDVRSIKIDSIENKNQESIDDDTRLYDQTSDETNKDRRAKFKCTKCPSEYENLYNFRKHLKLHENRYPYKCNECFITFTRRSHLREHLVVHTDPDSITCKTCQKMFSRKSHLKRHMLLHSDETKTCCKIAAKKNEDNRTVFICDQCPSEYENLCNFNRHIKLHENPELFKCNECSVSFTRRNNLKDHLIFHTNPELCTCKTCKKVFTRRSHLIRHELIHSDEAKISKKITAKKMKTDKAKYKCDKCPSGYDNLSNFNEHLKSHENPELFRCNECSISFTRRNNLKYHLLYHTNPDMLTCKTCHKVFSRKSNLNRHELIHSATKNSN